MTATLTPAIAGRTDSTAETPQRETEMALREFLDSPTVGDRLQEIAETAIVVKLGAKYVVGRNRDEDLISAVVSQMWVELAEKAKLDEAAENMVDATKLARTAARVLSVMERAKERSFRASEDRPNRSDQSDKLRNWWLMAPADQIALARTMCSGDVKTLDHAQSVLAAHTLPNDAALVKQYMPAKVVKSGEARKTSKAAQKLQDRLDAQKAHDNTLWRKAVELQKKANEAASSQLAQAYEIFAKATPDAAKLIWETPAMKDKKPLAGRISRRFSLSGNLGFTFVGPRMRGIPGTGPVSVIMERSLRDARSAESEYFRQTAENAQSDAFQNMRSLQFFLREPNEQLKGDGDATRSKGSVNWTEALETDVKLVPVTIGNWEQLIQPPTDSDEDAVSFHKSDVGLLVPVYTKTRDLGESGKAELMRFIRDMRAQAKLNLAHSAAIEEYRLGGRFEGEQTFSPMPDAVLKVDDLPELFQRFDGVTELQNRMDPTKPVEPSWYDFLTVWVEDSTNCPHPTVLPYSDGSAQCQRCGTTLHKVEAKPDGAKMGPFVDNTPTPTLRAARAAYRKLQREADAIHQAIVDAPSGDDLDILVSQAGKLRDRREKALETVLDLERHLPKKARKVLK